MKQFTKKWFEIIIVTALIDMQFSYVLAFLGKENIAETLSITIVTEIVGVFLTYCIKSFCETREAERTRLREKRMRGNELDD